MRKTLVNFNTLLLTGGFALLGWEGQRLTVKVESAHDDIIAIKADMVHRSEFMALEIRLAAVELDLVRLKTKDSK